MKVTNDIFKDRQLHIEDYLQMVSTESKEYAEVSKEPKVLCCVKTKYKELKKLGLEEEKAWICANMRNGNWYCGGYFVLQTAFNNKKLRELGYPTFTEFYLKVCEN